MNATARFARRQAIRCCRQRSSQRRTPRLLGLASLCLFVMGGPTLAHAFRCSQAVTASGAADGPSLSWPTRKLSYSLNQAGTTQLPQSSTFDVLRSAFSVWETMTLSADANTICGGAAAATDVTFVEEPLSEQSWTGYDYLDQGRNTNLVVFRDFAWTAAPTAGDIIALTTTTYSALTGVILDADIEFNTANEQFALANPNDMQFDLLSTAVHEIGHFLGLAHCSADPTAVCGHDEVMEPSALQGSTSKRRLACDDRAGLVFKYGLGKVNGYCADAADCASGCLAPVLPSRTPIITQTASDMGRGCAATGTGASPFAAILAAAGLFGATLWRRQRRGNKWLLVCLMAAPAAPSCQGQPLDCGGQAIAFDANAPLIISMGMVRQITSDPWHVLLALDFVDPDGDAGGGMVHYYANHSPTPTQSFAMADVFSSSGGLDASARSGRVQLLIRLLSTTPADAVLHLSTQLVDAQGHGSNCYGLDLKLSLQPADQNVLLGAP